MNDSSLSALSSNDTSVNAIDTEFGSDLPMMLKGPRRSPGRPRGSKNKVAAKRAATPVKPQRRATKAPVVPPLASEDDDAGAGKPPLPSAVDLAAVALMPVAAISSDGIIGQIEHWTGATLTFIPSPDSPVGKVQIDEADLSKLLALCAYKRDFEERRRQAALAAARIEIETDRSRFLDPDQFRAEIPDVPVTAVTPICKREPSATARAKALEAGRKMSNTKRLMRLAKNKISKRDLPHLRSIVATLDSTPIHGTDACECVPLDVSPESVVALLEYLGRHNVIGVLGTAGTNDRKFYASTKSADRLESLIRATRFVGGCGVSE